MNEKRNLYSDALVVRYPEGDMSLERSPVEFPDDLEDKSHTIKDGDTLLLLADFYFKDDRQWFKIADKNKDVILNPFDLPVGIEIIIPNLRT